MSAHNRRRPKPEEVLRQITGQYPDLRAEDYIRLLAEALGRDVSRGYYDVLRHRAGLSRHTSARQMFAPWEPLIDHGQYRNRKYYRFLEAHAVALDSGEDALRGELRTRYLNVRTELRTQDLIIRYSLAKGPFASPRTAEERATDPDHTRFTESRETFLARERPDQREH